MSSVASNKANSIKFPVAQADVTGKNGVHAYASATSTTSVPLPSEMVGRYLKVVSLGCDTMVAISYGAAQTLSLTATGAIGTGNAQRGATVFSSTSVDGIVPKSPSVMTPVFLNFISSATGGYVEIYVSELASV